MNKFNGWSGVRRAKRTAAAATNSISFNSSLWEWEELMKWVDCCFAAQENSPMNEMNCCSRGGRSAPVNSLFFFSLRQSGPAKRKKERRVELANEGCSALWLVCWLWAAAAAGAPPTKKASQGKRAAQAANKPNNSWIKRRNKMNFISLIDEMNWVGYGRQRPSPRRELLHCFIIHSAIPQLCLAAPRRKDEPTPFSSLHFRGAQPKRKWKRRAG